MEIDITTLKDLSILASNNEDTILDKLDRTQTAIGKEELFQLLSTPLSSVEKILEVQQTLVQISNTISRRPERISNGTIMVVERFYETTLDPIPADISNTGAYFYKFLHGPDYSLAKYSLQHCLDLVTGITELKAMIENELNPAPLKNVIRGIQAIEGKIPQQLSSYIFSKKRLSKKETLQCVYFFRYRFKFEMEELLKLYARLDAWYSMAIAMKELDLSFPEFEESPEAYINTKGLYHLLLEKAVPYDFKMDSNNHFMFLTGANMAGKSTFIKSVGTALFLAHTGMGVPAREMKLSYFDGLLSNINVIDNILKGESYFFNEVQRIKATIEKVSNGKKWLILIDELFKGTNLQDAMKCSEEVIKGLLRCKNSLFILSTHLYELGELLKQEKEICFHYFETNVNGDQLQFSYSLRDGISTDRLGYLIMAREGVVKLLQQIP